MGKEQMGLSDEMAPATIQNGSMSLPDMMQSAIEQLSGDGASQAVDALGKLMDLYERIEDRNAVKAFMSGMVKFQKQCPEIPRNKTASIATKTGGKFSYAYADTSIIRKIVKPILNELGFMYSFDQEYIDNRFFVVFILSHELGHVERYRFHCSEESSSGASAQQKSGMADTYAGRRAMQNGLGITLTDEKDLDGASPDRSGGDTNKIDDNQAANLQSLIEETKTVVTTFCAFFDITDLAGLTKAQYPKAISMLERKRGSK